MKVLVTVNPITLKPTNSLLPPWVEPIFEGQYQNAAEVDEAEWLKSISPKS